MHVVFVYAILTTALYYLGAQALVTRWLWSHYPKWLDRFMTCSACSGFWYGVLVSTVFGLWQGWGFLGLEGSSPITPVVVGLCSMMWTPPLAYLHLLALTRIPNGDD